MRFTKSETSSYMKTHKEETQNGIALSGCSKSVKTGKVWSSFIGWKSRTLHVSSMKLVDFFVITTLKCIIILLFSMYHAEIYIKL